MTKNEIADVLTEIGTLLELKGENPFKVRAYQSGARALDDNTYRYEMKAGTLALEVFHRKPNHPGAPHYVIHSFDDPIHALHEDLTYNVTITPHSAWQGSWTHVRDSLNLWVNVLHILHNEPIDFQVG